MSLLRQRKQLESCKAEHQWRQCPSMPAQGMDPTQQTEIDMKMIDLDGTDNKGKLGERVPCDCDGGV
jgi:hypothetical protein